MPPKLLMAYSMGYYVESNSDTATEIRIYKRVIDGVAIYTGKLTAILIAVQSVGTAPKLYSDKVVIILDSLSAI